MLHFMIFWEESLGILFIGPYHVSKFYFQKMGVEYFQRCTFYFMKQTIESNIFRFRDLILCMTANDFRVSDIILPLDIV